MKTDKKALTLSTAFIAGQLLLFSGLFLFRDSYIAWNNMLLLVLYMIMSLAGIVIISLIGARLDKKASVKKTVAAPVITAIVFSAVLWGLSFFINVVIGKETLNRLAIDITTAVIFIISLFVTLSVTLRINTSTLKKSLLSISFTVLFILTGLHFTGEYIFEGIYSDYKVASPGILFSENYTEKERDLTDMEFDYYVSITGDDNNDGSESSPFRTIEKAVEAVRNTDKTNKNGINVCIKEGEYRVSSLIFTEEDSGTENCPITYCADGNVVLNGGVTLSPDDFVNVSEYPDIASVLSEEAKNNVYVLDLTKAPYSLTKEDWGKLYAIGSYNTATSYDGDYVGPLYCELFVNDKRQTIARYPDSSFLLTDEVVSTGLGLESDGALSKVENWYDIRNPESDVYKISSSLAERISSWKTTEDVWMFGYWKYDWADASTPIGSFDKENRTLSPKFVSLYGTKVNAPYYFYNIPEELTTEGEWYLDRENGLLCLFAPENFSEAAIDLSLTLEPIINAAADYLTFDGMTVKGTRGDGIIVTGSHNTVQHCLIKNVAGNALIMTGENNTAYNNEITHTGKGGIILTGGNTETLTAGNNKADNNYIHDWSEIYLTYQPAVTLNGAGNICSHNEIANSPHEAITYSGNNHIIEYNLIHDVCLLSDDAGAIYSGRSWVWYGNIIRYNCIYNIGTAEHSPDGIYLDDALSGQKVYGNLLINIPKLGIHLGGGRDLEVTNNIIINAGEHPISYDARAREGALEDGWFTHSSKKDGDMWQALYKSPWQSEIWQEAFPQYKTFSDDFNNPDTPDFVVNPANSKVSGNLIFDKKASIGNINEAAEKFSDISGNAVYSLNELSSVFTDAENGIYTIRDISALKEALPDFEEIPYDEIGRK